ncbi:MAG: hypothetical protein Q9180_002303 [Flavoplaca navasiana]
MAELRESRTQKLKGAYVLVIGGSSGLGFTVALAALDQGAHVRVASSQKAKVDKAVAKLQEASQSDPTSVAGFVCDLSQVSELENNVAKLLEAATSTRKLDHIVLTAGDAVPIKSLAETSVSKMLAAGNALQAAWGSAVEGATRGLSVDLAPIRVNCVAPGAIETELFDNIPPAAKGAVLEGYRGWSLLGTLGTPDEAAESYVYLIKNSFVTGTISFVDGGRIVK